MSAQPAGASPPARCVLVTGAGRGLGRAMAVHLAAPGTVLFLHYHGSRDGARAVQREAEAKGARAVPLSADLADPASRERLLAEVARQTDALHVLVNNAGLYEERGLLETSAADWQRVFDVTCSAVFHLTQLAVPLLAQGAPARVVNVGDSGADRVTGRLTATPYHVAKLGVHVLTRSFAKALAPRRITVNQISPGFLENSIGAPGSPIPAGRLGTFADLLPALDFLLSPAAEYTTGANLVVSGGWNL